MDDSRFNISFTCVIVDVSNVSFSLSSSLSDASINVSAAKEDYVDSSMSVTPSSLKVSENTSVVV